MADTHTKKQWSENMAKIRSMRNKSTEMALISLLRLHKITGWRRHSKTVAGRPDFFFQRKKLQFLSTAATGMDVKNAI